MLSRWFRRKRLPEYDRPPTADRHRRITVYCPDRHLVYDGRTPDRVGVGGGVTARIRLAAAWARRGHRVTFVGNCRRPTEVDGVQYRPLKTVTAIDTEILVAMTTGGDLDLRPLARLDVRARLRLTWVGGVPEPGGLHELPMDVLIVPSNFIRGVAVRDWKVPPGRVFVCVNGVEKRRFLDDPLRTAPGPTVNSHRLVYASHPSKGLDSALEVVRIVRLADPRFELHVYGGPALWGEAKGRRLDQPGVVDHGLIGQHALARELLGSRFALHLQARPEPYGIVLIEALTAGCIVLASPVGAHPELIRHGENGFLLPGDHLTEAVREAAAGLLLELARRPAYCEYIRKNARATPFDWEEMAAVWEGLWAWKLDDASALGSLPTMSPCADCGGRWLPLADGYHCIGCGVYRRDLASMANPSR